MKPSLLIASRRLCIGLCLGILIIQQGFSAESCQIQSGPSPLLAEYIQTVRETAGKIDANALENACGKNRRSPSTVINQANDLIDQVKLDFPTWNAIGSDFNLNILAVMEGQENYYAQRDGKIFSDIENKILSNTIKSLGSRCQLTQSNANQLAELIRINATLEQIFKMTAAGNLGSSPSFGDYTLPESYLPLYQEIISTYGPDQIAQSCKNTDGEDPGTKIKKSIDTILKTLQGEGKKNDDILKDWKIALDLLKGGKAMGETKYNDYQRRLLQAEYARQGIGAKAIDVMLERFTCIKKEEQGAESILEQAQQRAKCYRINQENAMNQIKKVFVSLPTPTTTDQYLANLRYREREVTKIVNLNDLYTDIQGAMRNTEDNSLSLIENLGQMHINLTVINLAIEKRIPMMEKNCMKQIPSIVGACYGN